MKEKEKKRITKERLQLFKDALIIDWDVFLVIRKKTDSMKVDPSPCQRGQAPLSQIELVKAVRCKGSEMDRSRGLEAAPGLEGRVRTGIHSSVIRVCVCFSGSNKMENGKKMTPLHLFILPWSWIAVIAMFSFCIITA